MDLLRSCYASSMRPYPDRPDIEVPGHWHWCPKGARPVPYFHVFCSRDWDGWMIPPPDGIGEVPGRGPWRRGTPDPALTGRKPCGSADAWYNGAPYGTASCGEGCCPLSEGRFHGGILLGGIPRQDRWIRWDALPGGVQWGGTFSEEESAGERFMGGLGFTGIWTEDETAEDPGPFGGLAIGGTGPAEAGSESEGTVSGGLILGGKVVIENQEWMEPPTVGGMSLGGEVCDMCVEGVSPSGPVTASLSGTTLDIGFAASGITAGSYGGATAIPVLTVDTYGRITGVSTAAPVAGPGNPAPSAPTGLTATAGNASASLSWSAASGAAKYGVYYSTSPGGPWTSAGTTTSTSVNVTGLTNGTLYYFAVTAQTSGGAAESSYGTTASATPVVPPADNGNTTNTATGTSLTLNVPSSTASGDLLVVALADDAGWAWTVPSGWTIYEHRVELTNGLTSLTLAYHVAGSSEPASYTFTVNGSSHLVGWMGRFTNAAAPEAGSVNSASNTSTATATGVTSGGANRLAVLAFANYLNGGSSSITLNSPLASGNSVTGGTLVLSNMCLDVATYAVGSGATGNFTATLASTDGWVAIAACIPP